MNTSLELPCLSYGDVDTDVVIRNDRRDSPRHDCHTLVTAVTSDYAHGVDDWRVMKVHSEDVSITGAKLVSTLPLPGKCFYLRFLLPNFGKQFVIAEIVNQTIRKRVSLKGDVTQQFVYGVKFTGVVTDESVIKPLLELTSQPLQSHART